MKAKMTREKKMSDNTISGHINEYKHSGGHAHSHGHDQPHDHSHIVLEGMSKEEKTLRVLLSHWVDHNISHQEGFMEWVEKAIIMEKLETSDYIKKAITYMDEANKMLNMAKKSL